jgi:hypothetical protein
LTSFLDRNHFNYLVRKYGGDRYVKHFTSWNQMLALMFGQLSNRESLRDLVVVLESHRSKCYYLGKGKHVTRSNLAKADESRDCRIFEDFAYRMIDEARRKRCTASLSLKATSMRLTRPPFKNHWQIDLFFKWLKQHLKIKKFWGTSENAVKTQIYVAIITCCLVAVVQHDMWL